jgi:spore germination protein KB
LNSVIEINHRQMSWLVCTLLTAGGLLMGQRELVRIASFDAWFSYIIPLLYALGVAYLLVYLSRHYPRRNIYDISYLLCGNWGGKLVHAVLLSHLWMVLVRDMSAIASFVKATMLPRTPQEIIILCFVLVLMQYGGSSLEIPARVNDMFWPIFLLLILSLPIILANEFSLDRTQPIMGNPQTNLMLAGTANIGWFGDIIVVGAFLHTLSSTRQLSSSLRQGIIITGFTLTLLMFVILCVLGSNITSKTMYPSYTVLQQIHITDFLDRVDVFVFFIWIPITILRFIFVYLALLIGIQSMVRPAVLGGPSDSSPKSQASDYRYLNRAVGWFLLFTTVMAFHNIVEVFMLGNYGSTLLVLGTQLPILLLMAVLCWLKARKHRTNVDEDTANDKTLRQYKTMRRSSNLLLAVCFGIVFFGSLFGTPPPLLSKSLAVIYSVCLNGAALISRLETYASVKANSPSDDSSAPPSSA